MQVRAQTPDVVLPLHTSTRAEEPFPSNINLCLFFLGAREKIQSDYCIYQHEENAINQEWPNQGAPQCIGYVSFFVYRYQQLWPAHMHHFMHWFVFALLHFYLYMCQCLFAHFMGEKFWYSSFVFHQVSNWGLVRRCLTELIRQSSGEVYLFGSSRFFQHFLLNFLTECKFCHGLRPS